MIEKLVHHISAPLLGVLIITACSGDVVMDDDADAFVGTYSVSTVEYTTWGNASKTINETGTLRITKVSASHIRTSGFFSTQGRVSGDRVYLEAMHSSDSAGYLDDVFDTGTLSGDVLKVTGHTTGKLKSNGVLYPFTRSSFITAIKQ